jgi:putative endonuclease
MNLSLILMRNYLLTRNNKTLGNEGERLASEFLIKNGYKILEQNYRFHKWEMDIIAFDESSNYLVFVEVKTRVSFEFGLPEFAITKSKIKQLQRIGYCYLQEKQLSDMDCRFDVIAIMKKGDSEPVIEHYQNVLN